MRLLTKLLKIRILFSLVKNKSAILVDFLVSKKFLSSRDIQINTSGNLVAVCRAGTSDLREFAVVCGGLEYQARYFPIKQNPVIIDVGANIGSFVLYTSSVLAKYKPVVYGIEPSSENFTYLQKNIALNKLEVRARLFKMAISEGMTSAILDETDANDAFRLTHSSGFIGKGEHVQVLSLSAFFTLAGIHYADLVKIDVEGEEFRIFTNELDFIKKHISRMFVEVHELNSECTLGSFTSMLVDNRIQFTKFLNSNVLFLTF